MRLSPGKQAVIVTKNKGDVKLELSPAVAANGIDPSVLQVHRAAQGNAGFVVVKQAQCDDGVSSIDYPMEVVVDTGTDVYSGCCASVD
jgi:hypothetical protein